MISALILLLNISNQALSHETDENTEEVTVSQRFSIRVTRTVDEKLSRVLHCRAAAGSSRPCVCCGMQRKNCKNEINFGALEITHSSKLEQEIADFCLDNPLKMTRQEL